ncbi:glutathione S-transferase family protein [Gloeobacter kilaueensis]|uniref:Glutathione S-transferase n=1 Tax=Gloeobacter kilaueensis (strain ATCC BAA-2537 / CCAP 1431/1 / ULC 316 / JS1) TaxID=1183438 RepID=U5QKQ5_GLOK1|nr:glutathione S-transferase family protein [Gloeobacter kilaueensis]AGY59501.1 glutathione S-transferase [Gloeobacter kilaueensis JS1]
MPHLYEYTPSGNCYKIRLLLTQLGIPFERTELDIIKGETRTPEFIRLNPNGRVPLVRLDSGELLSESNAVIFYFAEGTPFLPTARLERAQVLSWLFWEQYEHEPNIATSRFLISYLKKAEQFKDVLDQKRLKGHAALDRMEKHLTGHDFFVAGRYTIADIALYAYTHVAEEGNFDLSGYPAIRAWLERVASQPGHIPITG